MDKSNIVLESETPQTTSRKKESIRLKTLKQAPIHSHPYLNQTVWIQGWIRTARHQKTFSFIEINDGSCLSNLQVIINNTLDNYTSLIEQLTTGSSCCIKGIVKESPGKGQSVEVEASHVEIIGTCNPENYPLQKKRHSFEFLRTIAHLRPRTNTLGAIARVRNCLAFATHEFFQQEDFQYIHTPIITTSDCEGAGEMFQITAIDPSAKEEKTTDTHFFNKPAYLTVSGQLNAEIYACALSDVYTFGPTFRAENSNTSRHLSEFWMIEPEMAFANLQDNMHLAERYLKFSIERLLKNCEEDMIFFDKFIEKGLLERLQHLLKHPFKAVTYTEAIDILEKSNKSFTFPVKWGLDLQSEHERYLTEEYFKQAIILHDYPKEIKAFYMRNNDDGKTVAAMDVLVPRVGEIIGGSQREERLPILEKKLAHAGLNPEDYWWYCQLREYGTVPHAGFGLGFERLIQFATGMENIRDVIPFPRYPGQAAF